MTRHLKSCGVLKGSAAPAEKPVDRIFHVTVAGGYSKEFWMHLEAF